jgi:hypothetical protein
MRAMQRLIAVGGLAVLIPGITLGQSTAQSSTRRGGAGFFLVGGTHAGLGDLNSALTSAGYQSFDRNGWTMGGGGYGLKNRLLIGGEGHGLMFASRATPSGRETRLQGGYGMFDIGTVIHSTDRATIYAVGGIGGAGVQLDIQDRDGTGLGPDIRDPTFDEVIRDPGRRSKLDRAAPLFGIGVGIDYFLSGSRGGFLVGARAGYRFTTSVDRWRLYGEEIIGGPDVGLTGPYVAFAIGGGGRR